MRAYFFVRQGILPPLFYALQLLQMRRCFVRQVQYRRMRTAQKGWIHQ